MRRAVRRSRPASPRLEAQVAAIARQIRVAPVPVRVIAGIHAPFVWSLGRPRLLWPETLPDSLPAHAVGGLMAHELAHLKRRDHWIGWIELAAACAWWWNPLFWYIRAEMRANAELACDGWATHLSPTGRRAYAEALLTVCALPPSSPAPLPVLGAGTIDRRFLERRLAMIMRSRVPVRLSRTTLCAVGLAAVVSLPAWAQQPALPAPAAAPAVPAVPARPPAPRVVTVPVPPTPSARAVRPSRVQVTRVDPAVRVFYTGPQAEKLPADAQALMDQFNEASARTQREADEQIARQRETVIAQLQKIQDTETKAGHLDEAVAVRDHIRQLQNPRALPPFVRATRPFVTPGGGSGFVSGSGGAYNLTSDGNGNVIWDRAQPAPVPPPPPAPSPIDR
jgi:hypothetical protein